MSRATSRFVADPTPAALAAAVTDLGAADPRLGFVVLLGEVGAPPLDAVVAALAATGRLFVGGSFPGVIHGERASPRGAVVLGLPFARPPQTFVGLGGRDTPPIADHDLPLDTTALVLVDGLGSGIARFLSELYKTFGGAIDYVGGGAGSLSLRPAPCLFGPDGVHQDAAVVAFLDVRVRLGVQHGWRYLEGPLLATRTTRNVIHELNWRPAFEVYRSIVEADSGRRLEVEAFFEVAKAYPFGIVGGEGEPVIRDPITVVDWHDLVCVGEVPANSSVGVFRGDPAELVAAARRAAEQAVDRSGSALATLVVDCVSRSIFLGDDGFRDELGAIHAVVGDSAKAAPVTGALTLGEVSSVGDAYVEFLNKTCVVASLYPR